MTDHKREICPGQRIQMNGFWKDLTIAQVELLTYGSVGIGIAVVFAVKLHPLMMVFK